MVQTNLHKIVGPVFTLADIDQNVIEQTDAPTLLGVHMDDVRVRDPGRGEKFHRGLTRHRELELVK